MFHKAIDRDNKHFPTHKYHNWNKLISNNHESCKQWYYYEWKSYGVRDGNRLYVAMETVDVLKCQDQFVEYMMWILIVNNISLLNNPL